MPALCALTKLANHGKRAFRLELRKDAAWRRCRVGKSVHKIFAFQISLRVIVILDEGKIQEMVIADANFTII